MRTKEGYVCINPIAEHKKWAETKRVYRKTLTNEEIEYIEKCLKHFKDKKCMDCIYFDEDEFDGDTLIPFCTHKEGVRNFKSRNGCICEYFEEY